MATQRFAPWYRREDYALIREIMDDAEDTLPLNFDEWEENAESEREAAKCELVVIEPVFIDPAEFFSYCIASSSRAGEVHQAYRIASLVRLWPCDPGDANCDVRFRTVQSPARHCICYLSADGAIFFDEFRIKVEGRAFLLRRVGDKATGKIFGRAGRFAQNRSDEASRTRFCCDHSELSLFCALEGFYSQLNKLAIDLNEVQFVCGDTRFGASLH